MIRIRVSEIMKSSKDEADPAYCHPKQEGVSK